MSHPRRRQARALCPVCNRDVAATVPYHGDGSAHVLRWHRDHIGALCIGSRMFVTTLTQEAAGQGVDPT